MRLLGLIIDKQDVALHVTKQIFVVPKNDCFIFKEEKNVPTNEPIHVCAL